MNDVKIQGQDFTVRQAVSASSSSKPVVPERGANAEARVATAAVPKPEQVKETLKQDASEQAERTREAVEDAVTRLNDYVQSVQRDLQFQLDESSGKTVVTVLDSRTNEVVRQIPDDVALRLARELQQDEPLSLFNAKV
jgi:flagellar protein FlaG